METECIESTENVSIENLPEEVLEYILSLISPYKDLNECMLVSKKWRRCAQNVIKLKRRNLQKAINEFDINWEHVTPVEMAPTITKRYSHAAIVHDNSMYVFGGCTSAMTTFNDLWRLDLTKRKWIRPLAMGTYPSPKACSSLVHYKDSLILFGGWTYPPSYPLYQSWHLFNELHVYDVIGNSWTSISTMNTPPPSAGHSVSIIGEYMILFGGLQKPGSAVHCEKSNDIWVLHLKTWTWCKKLVQDGPKPNGRFGQTQVIINDKNLLILGGSGGPSTQYSDCWVLNMEDDVWKWFKVDVLERQYEPANIWSNPGCKVGDKIVVLNRMRKTDESRIMYFPRSHWHQNVPEDGRLSRIDLANRREDVDENVNGRYGDLMRNRRADDINPIAGPSGILPPFESERQNENMFNRSGNDQLPPSYTMRQNKISEKREKRLEKLQKIERIMKLKADLIGRKRLKRAHYLGMYVLDISQVLSTKPTATWLPPKGVDDGPEETMLYTLVKGKSELIMFGGIQKDANSLQASNVNSQISNTLHFITSPTYVI